VVVVADSARRAALELHADEVAAELNVKGLTVAARADELTTVHVVPNFKVLGPKLGRELPIVKRLLDQGSYEVTADGVRVGDRILAEGEFERRTEAREGFENAEEGPFVVAVDTRLDDALVDEGVARDLVRFVQNLRIAAGLEITDRIRIVYDANERGRRVLERHGDHLASETLATALEAGTADHGQDFRADGVEVRVAVGRA
jgi:isoleucyl-tRNA synthetase